MAVKTDVRLWGYIREWGKASSKPRINQYRVRLGICPLAKASHWGNLRRQGIDLFEARVGRTAVSSECCLENGYGDVLPFWRTFIVATFL